MKLSVLMPVYNEVDTIAAVVARVQEVLPGHEIVLVNDASSDGTAEILDQLSTSDLTVIHHPVNRGKGAAIRTALEAATGDVVVIQDADLEYDPQDLPRLMAAIDAGQADVVYGVRPLDSQKRLLRWGNRFVSLMTRLFYGGRLQDVETCYKMMRREIAQGLDLECRRFDVEVEITAKLLRLGHKVHELPISYSARYENKKLSPLDGLPAMRALWKYRRWVQ
jgi:glycosyltransferase involved in cell wall biosynthesis